MRWFPTTVFKSEFFSPSFHLLFLFNPSELLRGWLCILHGLKKVTVHVRPPAPAGSTAGPWSGKTHSSGLVAQPGDAAGTPAAALLFHTKYLSHQHWGLLVPRLLVPPICFSLQRRAVKNCAWTHQHSLSFLKREPNSLARNNGRRWMPVPQMGWKWEESRKVLNSWSSSALPFTFFLWLVSTVASWEMELRNKMSGTAGRDLNIQRDLEREDPYVNLMKPNKVNCMVLSLYLSKPQYQYTWRMYWLRVVLWEGPAGAGGWADRHEPAMRPCNPESYKSMTSCSREVILPSTLLLWGPTWSAICSSGVSSTGKTWTCWNWCRGGHEDGQRDGAYLLWRQAVRAGVHPGEEQVLGRSYCSLSVQKGDL